MKSLHAPHDPQREYTELLYSPPRVVVAVAVVVALVGAGGTSTDWECMTSVMTQLSTNGTVRCESGQKKEQPNDDYGRTLGEGSSNEVLLPASA